MPTHPETRRAWLFSKCKGLLIYTLEMRMRKQNPQKSKTAYPKSDRFAEDGRRRSSAYDAAKLTKAADAAKSAFINAVLKVDKPSPRVKRQRRSMLIGGASLAAVLGVLLYLICAG